MKKLIAIIALSTTVSFAEPTPIEQCKAIRDLAESIMIARQNGVGKYETLQNIEAFKSTKIYTLAKGLVTAAYSPLFVEDEENVSDNDVNEFKNLFYTKCLENKLN